ncbi:MAG: hypothetical protein QM704_25445 [Anaeromyxobacteraceae bacterium]
MTDPRQKFRDSNTKPSTPTIEIPPRGLPRSKRPWRHDLREEEVVQAARALRAGTPWSAIREDLVADNVHPDAVERYRGEVGRRAAEVGPPASRPLPEPLVGRQGLRDADVRHAAALLRGGLPWPEVAAVVAPDVPPEMLTAWRPQIEAAAREPGPVLRPTRPPTPEEDRRRLDAWLESEERGKHAVAVRRSLRR